MRVERWLALALFAVAAGALAALPPHLEQQLQRMPEALRQQVLQRQAQLDAMPEDARVAMQARREHWDALPLGERAALREHWEAWRTLPAAQQQALREASTAFAALSPERQQALRADFARLSSDEQRGWLLGPRLGAQWMQLQPLLMQVPGGERAALLQALQALPDDGLRDLAILAQRTPPQARAGLRRELLSTTGESRPAWLRERMQR